MEAEWVQGVQEGDITVITAGVVRVEMGQVAALASNRSITIMDRHITREWVAIGSLHAEIIRRGTGTITGAALLPGCRSGQVAPPA